MSHEQLLAHYFHMVERRGLWSKLSRLRFYLDYLFAGVTFPGKRMLDIGTGMGLFALYAACKGADEIVCLEPEAAGSDADVGSVLPVLADELGVHQIRMVRKTLQEFDPGDTRFDIILSHLSINHWDEDACIRLRWDKEARRRYLQLFRKLGQLSAPGATLIVVDCARRNFWAELGLRSPFISGRIEWPKHQQPELWSQLLSEGGFRQRRIHWTAFKSLGRLGQVLLGHEAISWFLTSHFCLWMEKP